VVAGFFKILVVLDGGANVEGELGADNMVNGISEGGKVVKKDNLVVFKRGAGVINRDNLQDMMVNGVTFSKGHVHFRVVRMDVVIYYIKGVTMRLLVDRSGMGYHRHC
jgi:hypothetical protein